MVWAKLEAGARSHRKTIGLGPEAFTVWVCGLLYCVEQPAHDGFIPEAAVPCLYPGIKRVRSAVERITGAGLWSAVDGGFLVHDYHDHQYDLAKHKAVSEARKSAGRLGGMRSGEVRAGSKTEANAKQVASGLVEANAKQTRSKTKQIRSDETNKPPVVPLEGDKPKRRPAKSALPPSWSPNDRHREQAAESGVNCDIEADKLRDWAQATGNRYADWDAMFRNWLRKARPSNVVSFAPRAPTLDDYGLTPEQKAALARGRTR